MPNDNEQLKPLPEWKQRQRHQRPPDKTVWVSHTPAQRAQPKPWKGKSERRQILAERREQRALQKAKA